MQLETLVSSDRRQRLLTVVAETVPAGWNVTDSTSLIRSGLVDSLGLLNIAAFVERELGREMDAVTLDPSRDWDTVNDILRFIRVSEEGP